MFFSSSREGDSDGNHLNASVYQEIIAGVDVVKVQTFADKQLKFRQQDGPPRLVVRFRRKTT